MKDIEQIFDDLSSMNSEEVQARGMEAARQIKHLTVLIMPLMNKPIWYNCAKVIAEKSDEELKPYFMLLLRWLQDINWPGADIIYDRLLEVNDESFIDDYRISLSMAQKSGDRPWEAALNDFGIDYEKRHTGVKDMRGHEVQ